MKYLTPKEIRSSRRIMSWAQVSFPFPLYYFINNFILLQTKLLLYNSSITVAPPQSQHRCKQGAGRGKSKEMAGEGNRGSRCVASWAQVRFFFFLFRSSNMLTDTIVPWHQWQPLAHPCTVTTPILHPSDMATWRRVGWGGSRYNASRALVCFLFYILLLHI